MPSRWEVERAVIASHVSPNGRLIMLALLTTVDNATGTTLPHKTPSFDDLSAMTGLSKAVLSEWVAALEAGGWLERSKSSGRGKRTIYALRKGDDVIERRSRSLRVPRGKKGSLGEPFEDAETVRPANPFEGVNSSPGEPFTGEKGFAQRTLNSSPSEPFSDQKGSPSEPTPSYPPLPTGEVSSKPLSAGEAATGPAAARSSSAMDWKIENQQPRTEGSRIPRQPQPPSAAAGRTAPLFPKPKPAAVESWMEIHRVVYRWLEANGFETFGLDEVREIHLRLIAAYPGKPMPYLNTIIGNGGCLPYALDIRKARNKKINDLVREVQNAHPQCGHGIPAGDQPHPTTGALICAQCRRGLPASPPVATTNPAVQVTLDAYRRARGNNILIGELLNITQQIEAFLAEGAALDDVTALAELAGSRRVSLIQAAGATA